MWLWERKRERWEKGNRGGGRAYEDVQAAGASGTCVVSYHACRRTTQTRRMEGRVRWQRRQQKPQRPGWRGEGRSSSARFLQAIRGSQRHQENLGGPGGRNRQVTSHQHSLPGGSLGLRGRGRGHGDIARQLEKRLTGRIGPETRAPPLGSRRNGSATGRDPKQTPASAALPGSP